MRLERLFSEYLYGLTCILFSAPLLAMGAAVVLEDTGTYSSPSQPQFERGTGPNLRGASILQSNFRLHVRLSTRLYTQRQVRIYLSLPIDSDTPINVRWASQGTFLGGQIDDGKRRALLWEGVAMQPFLEGDIGMQLISHAPWFRERRNLDFRFELETVD